MNTKNIVYTVGYILLFFIVTGIVTTRNINTDENTVTIYEKHLFTVNNDTFTLQDNYEPDETIYTWNYYPQNCTNKNLEIQCEPNNNETTIIYKIKL